MTYFHPLWLEGQRKRFTRPDAYRFAPPGTPESRPPGWLDPSATRVRWKEAQEEEARRQTEAAQEEFERDLLELQCEVKKLKLDHELWLFEQKYDPSQPLDRKWDGQPHDELGRFDSGRSQLRNTMRRFRQLRECHQHSKPSAKGSTTRTYSIVKWSGRPLVMRKPLCAMRIV